MASKIFALSKVRRDMSKYLVYIVTVGRRNDKSGRSYVSFGNVCSEIEFTEACPGKLGISLTRVIILRSDFEDV